MAYSFICKKVKAPEKTTCITKRGNIMQENIVLVGEKINILLKNHCFNPIFSQKFKNKNANNQIKKYNLFEFFLKKHNQNCNQHIILSIQKCTSDNISTQWWHTQDGHTWLVCYTTVAYTEGGLLHQTDLVLVYKAQTYIYLNMAAAFLFLMGFWPQIYPIASVTQPQINVPCTTINACVAVHSIWKSGGRMGGIHPPPPGGFFPIYAT